MWISSKDFNEKLLISEKKNCNVHSTRSRLEKILAKTWSGLLSTEYSKQEKPSETLHREGSILIEQKLFQGHSSFLGKSL